MDSSFRQCDTQYILSLTGPPMHSNFAGQEETRTFRPFVSLYMPRIEFLFKLSEIRVCPTSEKTVFSHNIFSDLQHVKEPLLAFLNHRIY